MQEETFGLEQLGAVVGPLLKRGDWLDVYRELLNASPDGYLLQEAPGGRVLLASHAAQAFLESAGFSSVGMVQAGGDCRLFDATGSPYPSLDLPWVRALHDQRGASSYNLWVHPAQGRRQAYAARAVPLHDADGTCIAVLTHLRDLTLEKEAEEKMRAATTTDELTGTYNRRYLEVRIGEEIARALRYSHPLAGLRMDIDQFKEINDRHGHSGGDFVLQNVARLLRTHLRTSDVVGRWDGEEFVALLPETPLDEAVKATDRLRTIVQGASWEYGRQWLSVTVSAGLAAFDPVHPAADALLNAAERALAQARQTRNCVRVYKPEK